jgi:uncharacterized protein
VDRIYDALLREHLRENRQMALVVGPRQVGKTTAARRGAGDHAYLSWDRQSDRVLITGGPNQVARHLGLDGLLPSPRHVVFDEIHEYRRWRGFLKGFFDVYGDRTRTVVTGSARLGHFRRGGDSLMGRYFLYRMHPVSIGEVVRPHMSLDLVRPPMSIDDGAFASLLRFGGYPEPFLQADVRFYNRWRRMRSELLFREDLRDLTRIQEAGQVEVLGQLIASQAGQQVNYSSLAQGANVAVDTARRWISALSSLFFCFTISPWSRNVRKSLRKQPKVYLWDWSVVDSQGARYENFVAAHLLKAVDWWTDVGLGEFSLYYLRDKTKREVDFLVVRDGAPWFLVEVKSSGGHGISPALRHFQRETGASHAFQLAFDSQYVDADCFTHTEPIEVPARTLLSQLI